MAPRLDNCQAKGNATGSSREAILFLTDMEYLLGFKLGPTVPSPTSVPPRDGWKPLLYPKTLFFPAFL